MIMSSLVSVPIRYRSPLIMVVASTVKTPHRMNFNSTVNGMGVGGYITGRVLENSTPVSRRVMCYHRRTGSLISKTWSNENGDFRFDDLEPGIAIFLTSVNDKGLVVPFNAVTQDQLVSKSTLEEPL